MPAVSKVVTAVVSSHLFWTAVSMIAFVMLYEYSLEFRIKLPLILGALVVAGLGYAVYIDETSRKQAGLETTLERSRSRAQQRIGRSSGTGRILSTAMLFILTCGMIAVAQAMSKSRRNRARYKEWGG